MFTTVYAAETQFRLDSAQRDRELAHLALIRERVAALAERPSPRASRGPVAVAPRAGTPSPRAWARPIRLTAAHPQPACC